MTSTNDSPKILKHRLSTKKGRETIERALAYAKGIERTDYDLVLGTVTKQKRVILVAKIEELYEIVGAEHEARRFVYVVSGKQGSTRFEFSCPGMPD